MKIKISVLSILIASTLLSSTVFADTYVDGYTKRDGTYVSPHYRSSPDSSYNNNWSVEGNQNPYTGQYGSRSRTDNDRTPSYNFDTYGSNLFSN